MALLWKQWLNGFDSEQTDIGCTVLEDPTQLAPDTNEIDCTIASADDSHDRAVASLLTSAFLPAGASGAWRGRVRLVGTTTLSDNTSILLFNNTAGTPVSVVDVFLNASKQINWFSAAATITVASRNDTSTFALSIDTWYWVEIQWLCAGGTGYKKLWINTDPTLVGGANSPTISATGLTGTPANVVIGEARMGIDHLDGVQVTGYELKFGRSQMNDGAAFTDLAAPTNSAGPTVTGTASSASTLTCNAGTWTGDPSLTYQWQTSANGTTGWSNIALATAQSYTVQAGDVGNYLRCVVTGTNAIGNASANTAATSQVTSSAPVNTAAPTITGTPRAGNILGCLDGTWTNSPSYTYQWQLSANGSTGWADIALATAQTYSPLIGQLGQYLRCVVTAHNAASP